MDFANCLLIVLSMTCNFTETSFMYSSIMDLLAEPIWRKFWYPVAFQEDLATGPLARTVLATQLVIWADSNNEPCAAIDRCPHRDARLSGGWTCEGRIVCPYHGWEYGTDGRVQVVPQTPEIHSFPSRFALDTVYAATRYGVVWVCLDEPVRSIPELPDGSADGWRTVREFDEEWATTAPRLMENSFDPAHTVFVHRATFGDTSRPDVDVPTIERTPYGLVARNNLSVANPESARVVTGEPESEVTVRSSKTEFHAPFLRMLQSTYPGGKVHQIITAATPVDNSRLRLIQWAVRNDTEVESPAADIVAFDRRVTWEDQALLEGIWAPYSEELAANVHIKVDKPTVEIRRIYKEIRQGIWAGLSESEPAKSKFLSVASSLNSQTDTVPTQLSPQEASSFTMVSLRSD